MIGHPLPGHSLNISYILEKQTDRSSTSDSDPLSNVEIISDEGLTEEEEFNPDWDSSHLESVYASPETTVPQQPLNLPEHPLSPQEPIEGVGHGFHLNLEEPLVDIMPNQTPAQMEQEHKEL